MSSYSLAQNGYPKRIVWKNDTVNCYTDKQVKTINSIYIEKNQYKELYDTCDSQKDKRDTIIKELIAVKASLLKEREKSKVVIETGNNIITEVKVLTKRQKRRIHILEIKNKIIKGVLYTISTVGVSTTIALGTLYLLNKK